MRSNRVGFLVLGLCLGLTASPASAQQAPASSVEDTSWSLPDGERILEQSIVVPAPVEEVWAALTTSEGFASWAAPLARVDLRLGGIIETSYKIGAQIGDPGNIKNEILAYVPHRMLAFRNTQAPPVTRFDVATFQQLHTVIFLEALDPTSTKVTAAMPGVLRGEAADGVYRHFAWGNGETLRQLVARFEAGPLDWESVLAEVNQGPPDAN